MKSYENLRVLCTKCPANATIHHYEPCTWRDELLVWVECHGEHLFAGIDGEHLMAASRDDEPVLWKRLRPLDIREQFSAWERRLLEAEERLAVYRRFVQETKENQ